MGVAQGAMVLHDTMFLDLDTERIDKVMKPKIQGSMLLEEIFHDTDLEFFVFFSSMACVTGNPGQSAYAAANMFMSGLAAQRRQRGLNASAVHIGAIFGNGYVTRELTLAQQEFLKKVGNLWLSEQDFHTLFAEAVYAGQSCRGKNSELSTGLMMIEDSDEFRKNITWFSNPMFQHCVRDTQGADPVETAGKGRRGIAVKAQLQEAVSPDDVYDIIHGMCQYGSPNSLRLIRLTQRNTESFSAKLQASLQIEEGRPISDLTADHLGIDSLVAVDIRSWFIKEFQVEIPVLKILSGATVGEILAKVQDLLPKDLTPHLNPNAKGMSKPKQKVEKAKVVATVSSTAASSDLETKTDEPTQAKAVYAVSETIDNSSSTTSSSQADVPATDSAESTLSSSPTYGSDVDRAETGSGDSELSVGLPDTSISAYLEHNKLLDDANVTVSRASPISFAQSQFWFLEQFLEDPASALNITVSIDLQGPIDIDKLRKSVALVGQRHEALRTRFSATGSGAVVQEVLASSCLGLEIHEIDAESESRAEEGWHKALAQHRYRLSEGENMRVILLRRSASSFRLLIGYHHINMDGVSLEVVLRELQLVYDSRRPPSIRQIIQYPDFAEQQRHEYQSGQWKDDLKFWKEEFAGQTPPILPLLRFAKTRVRRPLTSYSSNTADFHMDQSLLAIVQSACRRLKVNPFHLHLAVFYGLLTRLLDVEDLCIGISSANRHSPEAMQSVGMYLNVLPLLLKIRTDQTFADVVKMVRDKSLTAFGHSAVPFDVIVSELGISRTTSNSPLFQVLVNYRPGVSERREFCDCQSQVVAFDQGQTAYDLALDVIENPGGDCRIILSGQSVFYGDREMAKLKDMYLGLLASFAQDPASRLNDPPLYSPEDVNAAIELGRGMYTI